jgi:signal transduction histidine kinase
MAEVSRISALVASQLKVDFVSSISHELRSPLHGILASVEFLEEDSSMTAGQAEIVNTIVGRSILVVRKPTDWSA